MSGRISSIAIAAIAAGKWPTARSTSCSASRCRGSRVVSGSTRSDTPGASCSSSVISGGISSVAVASAIDSVKLARASAGTNCDGENVVRNCCKAARTDGHSDNAVAVGCTP